MSVSEIQRVMRGHRRWLIRQEAAAAARAERESRALKAILLDRALVTARSSAVADAVKAIQEGRLAVAELNTFLSSRREYQQLIAANQRYGNRYYRLALQEIDAAKIEVMQQAQRVANTTTLLQYPPSIRGDVAGILRLVPVEETARIAALGRQGSPIRRLASMTSRSGSIMVEEMIRGTARGMSPREVARLATSRVSDATDYEVLRVTRTEMMRASRATTTSWCEENSDVVAGGVWYAELDDATCAVCYAMHGTHLELGEDIGTHPNCRCSNLPRTKAPAELGFTGVPDAGVVVESGEDAFANLPVADQKQILGASKYEAYAAGDIRLSDVVKVREHPDWGTTRSVGSLDHALSG